MNPYNFLLNKRARVKLKSVRGFSLIEMLIVIAIVIILSSFAITGFNSISTSHGVSQAAADAAGLLELARSEAVTRQTYVWVAVGCATNAGSVELQMAAVCSADGSATNMSATNLVPLSKVVRVRQVKQTRFSNLKAETRALGDNQDVKDILNSGGITISGAAQSPVFQLFSSTKGTITFTPRGEAMLKGIPSSSDGFDPVIGIGMIPSRNSDTASDDAAVVLDGATGMARSLRL